MGAIKLNKIFKLSPIKMDEEVILLDFNCVWGKINKSNKLK
jgi:hypothetical protein